MTNKKLRGNKALQLWAIPLQMCITSKLNVNEPYITSAVETAERKKLEEDYSGAVWIRGSFKRLVKVL